MRILIPVDGSEFSKAAVAFVASRRTLLTKENEIELINVQCPVPLRAARALGREIVASYYEAEATKVLKPATTVLKRAGIGTTARYVVGIVADTLPSIVANDRADMIVMGSHGHTALKQRLLGSVASAVAVSCTKPLLIVRKGTTVKRDSLRLGIAADGSAYGVAVARFVTRHRDLFGPSPSVSLIHVMPDLSKVTVPGWIEREVPTGIKPAQVAAIQKAAFESVFRPIHEVLATAGIAATEIRLIGRSPGDAIAAEATKTRLDLLALGSVGFGAAGHGVMGSVAMRVAARCQTPLLLVRET
jgi:nucleotide-binding universal stress UspA family protein